MLFPRESESREVKDLSGIWRFKKDDGHGLTQKRFETALSATIPMPVPSSYNDLTQDADLRDHVGAVWYETVVFIPASWVQRRIFLHFASVTHGAIVYVDGLEKVRHKGGYLPFEVELTDAVVPGNSVRITVWVDNTLDWTTLPPGEVIENTTSGRIQNYFHDFYNYAGIHRPVRLYTTPPTYINDLDVRTDVVEGKGIVDYFVTLSGASVDLQPDPRSCEVRLLDEEGRTVVVSKTNSGTLNVVSPRLWQPGKAYLYTFEARFTGPDGRIDIYRLLVGLRSVKVNGDKFLINGQPFYFRGFGKHEDVDLRGKGLDLPSLVKDFNLLRWIGANSVRTSHYPYAEEFMDLADREGLVVVDEAPAVGFNFWTKNEKVFAMDKVSEGALTHHLNVLEELYLRDRNHACVVMWSVGNEAATYEKASVPYFSKIAARMKELDRHRPVTLVMNVLPHEDLVGHLFDVVCFNSYESWYNNSGRLDTIEPLVEASLRTWHERYRKPVFVTEFGADALAGFHQDPPVMFTEEYQVQMIRHYQNVFDKLEFVIGEHVWAFADFATKQGLTRVNGNKKGVFTRQRQPKMAAFALKARWENLD